MKHGSEMNEVNDIFSYALELKKGNNEEENEQVTLGITDQIEKEIQYSLTLHILKSMSRRC